RTPTGGRLLAVPPDWADALGRGELVLVDEQRRADSPLPAPWSGLDAKLLAPLRANGALVGVLVLGPPPRRHPYTPHDCAFLRTAAYQIALALLGSRAFDQLDELNGRLAALNAGLEQQVEERTAALHAKNEELNQSLAELQRAYKQHEQNHNGMLRAERLATLGRLTAGLAHEINTPLSAVMNALRLISDLSREYDTAIGDPDVLPDDHHEIARELLAHATAATEWAGKAAAYIRGVKAHGRDTRTSPAQPFALRDALEDARALVAHRLQIAACKLELWEDPPGLTLIGDRSQLGQVLVNLISNAVDAYEERELTGGRVHLQATRSTGGGLRLRVTDWAGGIPAAVLPHVFEELYTTKSVSKGTGLGLWIARAQVEQGFGGTLDVITNNGSSCFTAEFPASACGDIPDAPRPLRRALAAAPAPAAAVAHAM
ncbi:MAG: ATP-binding protein, partial [Candidatus Binatia bacterium]